MLSTQTAGCVTCGAPRVGKSKYCREHREIARNNFLAMVKGQKEARAARDSEFEALFKKAHEAGHKAATEHTPTPMIVTQREDPLDDNSEVVKRWRVNDGACGFAWILIRPGNCAAAHYAKKKYGARKDYYGGVSIWVSAYDQSIERKEKYARAFAKVLQDAGIKAYANSRMD